jgi:uncharacterized damage-inducible protein DinB
MQIITASKEIIRQLSDLCSKLDDKQFGESLALLMNNSIGKHVRHIVEFYDLLIESEKNGHLSYDSRSHCAKTETDVILAQKRIKAIDKWLDRPNLDLDLKLTINYSDAKDVEFEVSTNMSRELAYNIEHAIHHMAIIRIAVENEFKNVELDKHFGVAFSTIRYRDDLCAR